MVRIKIVYEKKLCPKLCKLLYKHSESATKDNENATLFYYSILLVNISPFPVMNLG